MSNYALPGDMRNRLDGTGLADELLKDLCKTAVTATQDVFLNAMISNAEGLIDAYLNKYYSTPICTDQSNGFLKELTLDLSEYDVFKRTVGDQVPTKIKDAMERAMGILQKIADGDLAPISSNTKNSSLDLITDTPVFDEASMKVF